MKQLTVEINNCHIQNLNNNERNCYCPYIMRGWVKDRDVPIHICTLTNICEYEIDFKRLFSKCKLGEK